MKFCWSCVINLLIFFVKNVFSSLVIMQKIIIWLIRPKNCLCRKLVTIYVRISGNEDSEGSPCWHLMFKKGFKSFGNIFYFLMGKIKAKIYLYQQLNLMIDSFPEGQCRVQKYSFPFFADPSEIGCCFMVFWTARILRGNFLILRVNYIVLFKCRWSFENSRI